MSGQVYWVIQQDAHSQCLGCAFLEPVEGDCPRITYPDGSDGGLVCKLMDAVHAGKHIWLKEVVQ